MTSLLFPTPPQCNPIQQIKKENTHPCPHTYMHARTHAHTRAPPQLSPLSWPQLSSASISHSTIRGQENTGTLNILLRIPACPPAAAQEQLCLLLTVRARLWLSLDLRFCGAPFVVNAHLYFPWYHACGVPPTGENVCCCSC